MRIEAVQPDPALAGLLPGASYSDAFSAVSEQHSLDARAAAQKILARPPRWVGVLMGLRNAIVAPLGLKAGRKAMAGNGVERIGIFPVLSADADKVVLGLDDRHLDFRVAVEVAPVRGLRRRITVTTLVRPHNLLGRVYLRTILPFHRLIVSAMLARAEKV